MSEHGGEPNALERVTAEMRDEPGPELDWARVEGELMSRIDADERASRRSGAARIVAALAVAAAVALAAMGIVRRGGERAPAEAPVAAAPRVFGPGGSLAGADLVVGDQVVSEAAAVSVEHPGRARYVLEPHSRLVVASLGKVLGLELGRGAVSAEVVPSPEPETFVIETDSTRVAVHGTSFRVARTDEGVEVAVREGVVAVGAKGQPPSHVLRQGDSGTFARDGTARVRRAAELAPAEPAVDPKPSASVKPTLTATPPTADLERAVDQAARMTTSCFAGHEPKGEVRVQVRTHVSATFAADGKLQSLVFDPPLSPSVRDCVQRQTAKLRVPESARGGSGERDLLLSN